MSKRQKTKPFDWSDFQFDQSLPDFERVRRVDLEDAETPADVLSQTRLPSGMIDRQRDLELVPTGRNADGIALRTLAANSQSARIADGRAIPVSLDRVPIKGGIAVVARIGKREIFRSPAMSEEEADLQEAAFHEALSAFASAAAPLLAAQS